VGPTATVMPTSTITSIATSVSVSTSSGLSGGAIGGIVAGVVIGLLAISVIAALFYRRTSRRPLPTAEEPRPANYGGGAAPGYTQEKDIGAPQQEVVPVNTGIGGSLAHFDEPASGRLQSTS